MRKHLCILLFLLLALFVSPCWGATYNYYFSDDAQGNAAGDDTTGDGSIGSPWKTLSKARTEINSKNPGDTVNLYFDRGDTWSANTGATATTTVYGLLVDSNDPVVSIDAYGIGAAPIFDGLVADFSSASNHNASTGPLKWNRWFEFQKTNCSIANIEIKNVYGNGIYLNAADGFTLRNSKIHNFGSTGIQIKYNYGIEDCLIEHNEFHTGEQLLLYGKKDGWSGAINLVSSNFGNTGICKNNVVRYNLVYDIYGEGINASNSVIEYNVVGDTYSIGIHAGPHDYDTLDVTVRYNFVIRSNNGIYGLGTGIRLHDELGGGDNSSANVQIYGNIVINRNRGFLLSCNKDCGNPFGSVKIYNNMAIDSVQENYKFAAPGEVIAGYAYNNSSIRYDRIGTSHSNDSAHANWTFSHNAFYPVDGSNTVGTGWTNNYVTGDPKLPGEEIYSIDWDGLTGSEYYNEIDFNLHLYPPSNSPLVDAGKTLNSPYATQFLTWNTDFENVLSGSSAFVLQSENNTIGAAVRSGASATQNIQGIKFQGVSP